MVNHETCPLIHVPFTNSKKHVFIRGTHKGDSYGHIPVFLSDPLETAAKVICSVEK